MGAEPNPYSAPAADGGAAIAGDGPSLLARLWLLGLAVGAALGGLAALATRALAWEPTGASAGLVTTVIGAHFRYMVFLVLTGSVMTCAVFAGTRLRPPSLAGPAALGLAGWAAWSAGALLLWLFTHVTWLPVIWAHCLLAIALASTAASVAFACARPKRDASRREQWLAWLLAAACGALAVAYALFILRALPAPALVPTFELIVVIAALVVAMLARERAGSTQVARIYRFAGVVPSALIWLGLGAVLAIIPEELHLGETFVVTARHHAAGSAALCAVLALVHSSFEMVRSQPFREGPARAAAVLVCLGLLATTVIMYLLGASGMPMRYVTYIDAVTSYQRTLTLAALATAAAVVMVSVVALLPAPSRRGL